ncbi:MAG: sugar phosphate isomerase/epimerase, partial [Anaerolineales bacterium]|nr:sugar phosphate isomerase/epimerase [Anaerolineales bacterium]
MGYAGVETASLPERVTPQQAASLYAELGLKVCGSHAPLPLGDQKNQVLEMLDALGSPRLICPWMPVEDFATVDGIKTICEQLNEANAVAKAHDLAFGYHNHWQEHSLVDGHRAYEYMLDFLEPDVFFEVDTYWAKVAGNDPVAMVKSLGERAPLLHIKDGPATREDAMTAVGDGVIDVPAIIKAGEGATQWLIVELDRCDSDMLTALEKSIKYLVENELGHGR